MDIAEVGNLRQRNAGVKRVREEFLWKGGSCVDLDRLILKVRDRIATEILTPSNYDYKVEKWIAKQMPMYYRSALVEHKSMLEGLFITSNCADKIETLRQNESGVILSKRLIEEEEAITKPSNTGQEIYIGIGALVLLVGLLILVRK